jgi:long-chain acyl-CoA synthetase
MFLSRKKMNIFNLLVKQKIKNYNKIALVIDEEEYSYGKLTDKIIKMISFFKKNGINHKSKILILEDNSIIQILTLFAASYLNITIIPLGTSYNPHQVKDFIKITDANCIIGNSSYIKLFKNIKKIKIFIETNKKDFDNIYQKKDNFKKYLKKNLNINKNYIISMTSGSTSSPKPIIFTQNTKIIRYKLFKKLFNIDSSDTLILTSPISTSLGMRILFSSLLTGATCIIMRKFYPNLYFDYVKKYKVTFSALVPSQIDILFSNNNKHKKLYLKKGLLSASSKLFDATKKKIINRNITLFEMYGAAEIGTITNIKLNKKNKNFTSVGRAYDKKISIKILSENNKFLSSGQIGEILCKTPAKFKGYLGLDNLTNKAFFRGYFKTGDLGYLDKNNNLFYSGRKKNIIKRSGLNIYPEDIENILLQNSKFEEVAIIPVTEGSSTKIILFVKKKHHLNYEYVRNICMKKLSTFQLPNEIKLIPNFPKTLSQKIDKLKIKETYLKKLNN